MTTVNKATNGVAKNPAQTGKEVESQKPELSKSVVDKGTGEIKSQDNGEEKAEGRPSIEARLKKLEELQELSDKRDVIVSALENLNKFYINPTGQGANLKLTDSKNNSFGIAHPAVIGEMVHMAKAKLQDELTKIEDAFVFSI